MIPILDTADIAAMKILAIEDRGTKRDFIDLYFLCQEFSLKQMLKFYDQKYGVLEEHLYSIIRSLDYFTDADIDPNPEMLIPVDWEEIKQFFKKEAIRLAHQELRK